MVSSDDFFYNLGALTERRRARAAARSSSGRARSGSAARPGSTSAARTRASCPSPQWRAEPRQARERSASSGIGPFTRPRARTRRCGIADGRPVVGRRQREPRRRPGRPRGDAAAARGRLLGDRERRHGRAPAHRPRGRRARRHRAAADRPAARRATSTSHPQNLDAIRTACTTRPPSRAAPRPTCSATSPSQYPSTARPAPPSTTARPTSPGMSATCRDAEQADPGRGDRRAGRLRRRGRGAGGAADPLAVVLRQARPVRRGELDDAVSAHSDPAARARSRSRGARPRAARSTRC